MSNKKRSRTLIGKEESGGVKIIMAGPFSLKEIRYWSGFYELVVKGTSMGRNYCWKVAKTKVVEKYPDTCPVPNVNPPPINKIVF